MVSFRSAKKQAELALEPRDGIGTSRHKAKLDGQDIFIHSYGTLRNYRQALKICAEWYADQRFAGRTGFSGQVRDITRNQAQEFLWLRADLVGQKALDLDRQALEKMMGVGTGNRLKRVQTRAESGNRLAARPRAYSPDQVTRISSHQSPQNSLSTIIAANAGLRAHELLTISTPDLFPPSEHRFFRADRFAGLRAFRRFTVVGKGGLIREVAVTERLAEKLDSVRLDAPRGRKDRGIWYQQQYDLGGGQSWSQSFSEASVRALGWSVGAHGVRHSYAQRRFEELQISGFEWDDALEIVSQELGHFRKDVTEVYLR